MQACVSSLSDVVSYKQVRDNKNWLTTSEAIKHIENHCPGLKTIIDINCSPSYVTLYRWSKTKKTKYNSRPAIQSLLVYDNGRRSVRFWNKDSLNTQDKIFQSRFFNPCKWSLKHCRWTKAAKKQFDINILTSYASDLLSDGFQGEVD